MAMITVPSPLGTLQLRPETDEDRAFRFHLFCESRPPELALLPLDAAARDTLMRFQFQAQTLSYRTQFPDARFDIIELAGERIGRIVVNRPGTMTHIVDHVITPPLRNRGIGTALLQALMAEAGAAQIPVRLKVASSNDPSLRLYRRLGFTPIETVPLYIELEWRAPPGKL
jgi:ribosomal protein S18 acetylase RimI-like enzyme